MKKTILAIAALSLSAPALALKVNGNEINPLVLETFAQQSMRTDYAALSADQKQTINNEVAKMFLLAAKAEKEGIHDHDKVQIELARTNILARSYVSHYLDDMKFDDADIQAAYEQKHGGEDKKQFQASHILVDDKALAAELLAKVKAGEDFASLAKEHSKDPGSGARGGDLGWFGEGVMVKPFETAIKGLEKGGVSDLVQTQFGYHIIKLVDTRAAPKPSLDQARPQLEQGLKQEAMMTFLDGLLKDAEVEH